MEVKLVTAYVPIPGHPRTAVEYGALGEKLGGVPVRKKAYYDQVPNLWLWKHVHSLPFMPQISAYDNAAKNTLAYHCVNHEKFTWLKQAADADPGPDVFVWVDYGIFSLPGMSNEAIYKFFAAVDNKKIYIPGCWNQAPVEAAYPSWRFCGSMFAVPREWIDELDFAVRSMARKHIRATKNVEWEVNTLARVEQATAYRKLPIHWYRADHDVSMFTNFKPAAEKPQ